MDTNLFFFKVYCVFHHKNCETTFPFFGVYPREFAGLACGIMVPWRLGQKRLYLNLINIHIKLMRTHLLALKIDNFSHLKITWECSFLIWLVPRLWSCWITRRASPFSSPESPGLLSRWKPVVPSRSDPTVQEGQTALGTRIARLLKRERIEDESRNTCNMSMSKDPWPIVSLEMNGCRSINFTQIGPVIESAPT